MSKKIIIFSIIIVLLLIIGIYKVFFQKGSASFSLVDVSFGNVSQEVSETGQVKKGEEVNLGFKSSGQVEKIWVEVGEKVKEFDPLLKLDTTSLKIQLQESKSALAVAQARLDKLLFGATPEEIQTTQTEVKNGEIALKKASQILEGNYEDTLNVLDDAYLKAYNSQNTVETIQRTYFINNDQIGLRAQEIEVKENEVKENKEDIKKAVSQIKSSLDSAKSSPTPENFESSLSQTKENLSNISDCLKIIREACEESNYRNLVSSTDKTSLDTQRANINTGLTNITNSQQAIASAKLSVESAEGQLQVAKDNLTLLTASPRQEDVDLYEAQVVQAQAQAQLLEKQIEESTLRSPCDGEVIKINKKIGEIVQPVLSESVITILPDIPFTIEVNVYEEDVVKIKIGNPVDISLVAFPDKVLSGEVILIDPAEKLKEGVVYYTTTIDFSGEIPEGLKPGMTADITIKTAQKDNVLIIPKVAFEKKDGKNFVNVLKDKKIHLREIQIGLVGSNDMVEVLSGLSEGESVVVK